MNKRKLYESIMRNVAKQVKKALNEASEVLTTVKRVIMPVGILDDQTLTVTGTKVINFNEPLKKYVIYFDRYHNKKHIASVADMICTQYCCDDFEDFNANDVIATFDNLEDAVMYAIKDSHSTIGSIFMNNSLKGYADSIEFLRGVLNGESWEQQNEDIIQDCFSKNDILEMLQQDYYALEIIDETI